MSDCKTCEYLDRFNCCCSNEPMMTCKAEMEEHDATVIDDFANFLCKRIPYAELSIPQLVEEFKKEKKK